MRAGTYQVKCLTIWFNFMFFHIFDKAAVGIPRKGKKCDISNMQITNTAKLSQQSQNLLIRTVQSLLLIHQAGQNHNYQHQRLLKNQTVQKCISFPHMLVKTHHIHTERTLLTHMQTANYHVDLNCLLAILLLYSFILSISNASKHGDKY